MTGMPQGRITTYTDELAYEICERLADGEPLAQICRDPRMPQLRTVYNWQEANEAFKARIARAREDGYDSIACEALSIMDAEPERVVSEGASRLDGASVQWAKNRAELRLKLLAKWDPRRYGDKLQTELSGPNGGPVRTLDVGGLSPEQIEALASIKLDGE